MRGAPCEGRWLMRLICGVVTLACGALGVPCSRADAPADQPRAKAGLTVRSQARRSAREQNKKDKLSAARSASRPTQRTRRAKSRAPKAPEQQALDVEARGSAREQDVATGPDQPCHVQLRAAGVSFVKVKAERAPGVRLPVRLTGAVGGVEIKGAGKNKATHYLDCRLGLALVRWAPQLKAAGVQGIDHYSIYRPDAAVSGTGKLSGHALALAIDAARFHMRDGRTLTVLDNWTDKTKGADPCAARPRQSGDERLLRELVCDASKRGIFQTVVTPHHNPEHDNHVHLEVSEFPAPTWIH